MTLDDWKQMTPEEEEENYKCDFCEKPINHKGFCSPDCELAQYND